MSTKVKRGVFPTHLTPFEAYMFVDDHPRFPMTFAYQLDFIGEVQPAAFQTAVDQALQRHPMLRAVVRPAKGGRDCWVLPDAVNSEVDFGDFDKSIRVDGASEYIDLRNEIGFRCWVRSNSEKTRIIVLFHHSAVDGIGAYQFLNDVLWFYAREFGNHIGQLRELSPMAIRSRLRANVGKIRPESNAIPDFDVQQNQPILPVTRDNSIKSVDCGTGHKFPHFHSHIFDKDQYRNLRLLAQDRGQTLNDCMVESLLVGMMTWNQSQGGDVDEHPFCVLMPLDLRQSHNTDMSAANVVTSSFIRRTADEIRDRQRLKSTLVMETTRLKHLRHESDFMKQLVSAPLGWTDIDLVKDEGRCQTSVIFSNAGDPTKRFPNRFPKSDGRLQSGNLVLDDLNGASPLRCQTRASVNLFTYQRKLKIGMRCDPQCFSEHDGKALLEHFVQTFLETLRARQTLVVG